MEAMLVVPLTGSNDHPKTALAPPHSFCPPLCTFMLTGALVQAIERRLVAALQRHVREYQTQDLACLRCGAVASGHLRPGCGVCGGDVRATLPSAAFRKRLMVFKSVGSHHGFPLLEQMAGWLLEGCPAAPAGAATGAAAPAGGLAR